MEKAKLAVQEHLSKAGHHDTTVHEKVAPAVTHETINQHRHENVTTAIDKEIHQDHYHTSIQPVLAKEKLPEQHHHNIGAVEHRQFEHGNDADVQARLQAEQAKFRDETIRGDVKHTSSAAPIVAGEHIHHHVHEQIQPVINKQTIEPHVVHTTIPIHEVHHNAAQHHSASALPAVSLADFKKQGGVLTGREERYDGFEGEPRSMVGGSTTGSSTTGGLNGTSSTTTAGPHSSNLGNKADPRVDSDLSRSGAGYGSSTTGTTGTTGSASAAPGTSATTNTKPSLLDRLNPMKDTDGDGKKGLMD